MITVMRDFMINVLTPPAARNILLLTLILDNDPQKNAHMWSLYFHIYIDYFAYLVLRLQAVKLFNLAANMETWTQGPYSSIIRFVDNGSLAEARQMFEFYGKDRASFELVRLHHRLEAVMDKAKTMNFGLYLSTYCGVRSAFPAAVDSGEFRDALQKLHIHYWRNGGLSLLDDNESMRFPNTMFLSFHEKPFVHPAANPLLGFHLALACGPIGPLFDSTRYLCLRERLVVAARSEFHSWVESYRKETTKITLRFCIADPVPLAHTLKNLQVSKTRSANWYRKQFYPEHLILDGPDYQDRTAPLAFDVIDTASLCDDMGPLVLLSAVSPLLRHEVSSTLYTERLKPRFITEWPTLLKMLNGNFSAVTMLLGLHPAEFWTGVSPLSSGEEAVLGIRMGASHGNQAEQTRNTLGHLRISWKRPVCLQGQAGPSIGLMPIEFDPKELAGVLGLVYKHMFLEDRLNEGRKDPSGPAVMWHHGLSFVAFLRLVQTRVETDWNAMMCHLLDYIKSHKPDRGGDKKYQPEIFSYLQILDVFRGLELETHLKEWLARWWHRELVHHNHPPPPSPPQSKLADWKNIPPVVCVTIMINHYIFKDFHKRGGKWAFRPSINCNLRSVPYDTAFPACQIMRGEHTTKGRRNTHAFKIHVFEVDGKADPKSPWFVSFYVPSVLLLEEPDNSKVCLTIHQDVVVSDGRVKLNQAEVFGGRLCNHKNVFITRYAPGQAGFPKVPGFGPDDLAGPDEMNLGAETFFSAGFNPPTSQVITVVGQIYPDRLQFRRKSKIVSGPGKKLQWKSAGPWQVNIEDENMSVPFTLHYPIPVVPTPTGSLDENAPEMSVPAIAGKTGDRIYPIYLPCGEPVIWNLPYLNLEKCPIIDTLQSEKVIWLKCHFLSATSDVEYLMLQPRSPKPSTFDDAYRNYKESIYLIFMRYVGHMGTRPRVIVIRDKNDDLQLIIMPSSLRLDLSNRSAVLDCAIISCHPKFESENQNFLQGDIWKNVYSTSASDEEIAMWQKAVPAFVERCRTWSHEPNVCEYYQRKEVPVSRDEQKKPHCSCGDGKFPPGFLEDVDHWDKVSPFAVRAAISSPFWAPSVADCRSIVANEVDSKAISKTDGEI